MLQKCCTLSLITAGLKLSRNATESTIVDFVALLMRLKDVEVASLLRPHLICVIYCASLCFQLVFSRYVNGIRNCGFCSMWNAEDQAIVLFERLSAYKRISILSAYSCFASGSQGGGRLGQPRGFVVFPARGLSADVGTLRRSLGRAGECPHGRWSKFD